MSSGESYSSFCSCVSAANSTFVAFCHLPPLLRITIAMVAPALRNHVSKGYRLTYIVQLPGAPSSSFPYWFSLLSNPSRGCLPSVRRGGEGRQRDRRRYRFCRLYNAEPCLEDAHGFMAAKIFAVRLKARDGMKLQSF